MKFSSIVLTTIFCFGMLQSAFSVEQSSNINKNFSYEMVEDFTPINDVCGLNFNVECVVEKSNREILAAPVWMNYGKFYESEYKSIYSVNKEKCKLFKIIYLKILNSINEEEKFINCTN